MEKNKVIIDVRERDEFDAERISQSINIPLSQFNSIAPGIFSQIKDKPVILMCRSGQRAKLAQQQIGQLGFEDAISCEVYTGGILEWKKQGNPTEKTKKTHLPILRQVQLIAGLGVLIFSLLAFFADPRWAFAAAFFGAGLAFAGLSGICALAVLLTKMPWNKGSSYDATKCS